MKRKLFNALLIVILISLFLGSIISVSLDYSNIIKTEQSAIINILQMTRNSFQNHENKLESLAYLSLPQDYRLSVFDEGGRPIYDSHKNLKNYDQTDKNLGVEDLSDSGTARNLGIHKGNIYASLKTEDGTIIRISKEMHTLNNLIINKIPALFVSFLVLIILASILANSVVNASLKPLNESKEDLENINLEEFPELAPFISQRKMEKSQLEDELNEIAIEKKTMETMLENMRQGMIILDENKDIVTISQEALDLLKWDKEVDDLNIIYLIRDEEFLADISRSLTEKEVSGLLEIDEKIVRYYLTPVEIDHYRRGVIILLIDETQRIQNETIRREFSSNVSHELKTPLTSISGFAELLINGLIREEDKKDIYDSIYNESQRLLSLIEDIMIISKLEEGESVEYQDIDIRRVIDDILFSYSDEISKLGLDVKVSGQGEIYSNNNLVWKAYSNIIENAIKYNKEGGSIDIKIIEENDYLLVSIEDTGIGISEKDLDRIFERFFRAEKSRNRELGGTGLGLSIVKHSVNSLNGSVDIESKLNQGTKFIIRLPKSIV